MNGAGYLIGLLLSLGLVLWFLLSIGNARSLGARPPTQLEPDREEEEALSAALPDEAESAPDVPRSAPGR